MVTKDPEIKEKDEEFRSFKHYHPAFRRLPQGDRPLIECPPLNHPHGKGEPWRP